METVGSAFGGEVPGRGTDTRRVCGHDIESPLWDRDDKLTVLSESRGTGALGRFSILPLVRTRRVI